MKTQITKVNFTYALIGGMWIERADGSRNWETWNSLVEEVGASELARLRKTAHNLTGCWHWA